ncbi:MAG: zinc dependent phospholipase C family protein [Treponema sp.]|jgi:hypothetical protein|nr:zinc dependent phospholipase C family protein [Treponema sp.]
MPSQILHTLFGEDVVYEIYRALGGRFGIVAGKAMEKITREYKNVFALGCQGPDIFYHNQRTRPYAVEYGTLLHRRGYGVFTANLLKTGLPDPPPSEEDIRAGRREKGINALGVYALGFMTHAVLDRFCHPYIVYYSVPLNSPSSGSRTGEGGSCSLGRTAHPFFERILDVFMLKELRGLPVSSWDQEAVLGAVCEKPPLGLKELLARSLIASYPERTGTDKFLAQRVENTFADAARFYRATNPASNFPREWGDDIAGLSRDRIRFLASLFPRSLPPGIDFLNLEHKTWRYPAGTEEEDTRSFPEIYAGALDTAVKSLSPCIIQYLEKGTFPIKDAAQSIGNGGLSLQDEDGRPLAPRRTCPLALDKVFEWHVTMGNMRENEG